MSKPDDIPQNVWDRASAINALPEGKFSAWRQSLHTDIARAIMAAVSEETEACAQVAEVSMDGASDYVDGYNDACSQLAAAIRKRGEAP